ncbi:unnamed protein product [Discula destructiva]
MGRTLPWKKQGAAVAAAKNTLARTDVPSSSPEHAASRSEEAKTKSHISRTSPQPTSSSVAPSSQQHHDVSNYGHDHAAPMSSPPKPMFERFMIPGLDNDDQWRMVEDEFVAVAQKFTAHLHAAEYQRRLTQTQAKDQNSDDMRSHPRPVVGAMTDNVKRDKAVSSLRKSQTSSIKQARARTQAADEEDLDELPWAGTNLEGLMDSPRKKRISLARMVSAKSDTRAAALSRKNSTGGNSMQRTSSRHETSPSVSGRKRKHSGRFSPDDSDEDIAEQDKASKRPRRSLVVDPPSSSSHTSQRPSSRALERSVKASVPLPQPPASVSTHAVPNDDSDSSVDLLFDLGNRLKKRRILRR